MSGGTRAAGRGARLISRMTALVVSGVLVAPLAPRTAHLHAQAPRIAELTVEGQAVPVRLVGYGIVAGLDGTGDRGTGARSGGMTVQSVANLLRRFDVEIPAEVLRTRNVAAVLVTAELNPYLRPGGRFEVSVSSLGDARSLRGGVLWMTPLVADPDGPALATAQGALLVSDADYGGYRIVNAPVNSGRIPQGGILEGDLPRPAFATVSRLVLRDPDLGTATRVAQAVNAALGEGVAKVEDPGSVQLALPGSADEKTAALARIRDLRVRADRRATLVIDARSGTIVAGGDLPVGAATVSHNGYTLAITSQPVAGDSTALATPPAAALPPGAVRVTAGAQASEIAAALHAVQAPVADVAAIFAALRDAGAIAAELVVR